MMNIQASSVRDAVRIAEELKASGKCQWFRGQRENWHVRSTFMRLDEQGRENARIDASKFEAWVQDTPGLESLGRNFDKAIAVMQHYGMATQFVDFTTEPRIAGYFASGG